jgi:hypothetical protein
MGSRASLIRMGNVTEVPKGIDPSSPHFVAAHHACRALLPRGPTPAAQPDPHELQALVRFARCMRAHGVRGSPDPSPDPGTVQSMPPSVDTYSPQFALAQQKCRRLVPGLFGPMGLDLLLRKGHPEGGLRPADRRRGRLPPPGTPSSQPALHIGPAATNAARSPSPATAASSNGARSSATPWSQLP